MDGPLGWTTKQEVFTLGIRVICAADVVLRWDDRNGADVRMALRKFADAGSESELNGLWSEKSEQVLDNSVLRLVQDVHRGLATAQA